MFPTGLLLLGLGSKDPMLIKAVAKAAPILGIRRLIVAHVDNFDPLPAPLVGLVEPEPPEPPAAFLEELAELRALLPDVDVEGVVRSGPPEYVLSALVEGRDVDLFIMGRVKATGGKARWGSASRKLLRLTTCSALILPAGSTLDLSHVVVGLDFSHAATSALAVACRIADKVTAVYQYNPRIGVRAGLHIDEFRSTVLAKAQKHLDDDVLPLIDNDIVPDLVVHAGGKVASVLLQHAKGRTIVLGARGLTPLAAMLLGSSADRVAGRSNEPVLVVRQKGSVMGVVKRLMVNA